MICSCRIDKQCFFLCMRCYFSFSTDLFNGLSSIFPLFLFSLQKKNQSEDLFLTMNEAKYLLFSLCCSIIDKNALKNDKLKTFPKLTFLYSLKNNEDNLV